MIIDERQEKAFWDAIEVFSSTGSLPHIMIIGSWAEYLYTYYFVDGVVNGRFCPQSVRSFCPIVAGFNAGTYKVPACVL